MRIRRRYAILVAVAATAFAAFGAAGAAQANNVSTLPTWNVTPSALPGPGGTPPFANAQLTVQTHTNFTSPGNKPAGGFAKTVTLSFDDDVKLNLAGLPSCTATFGGSTTIAQAWERCGPGADTSPEVNAYLSPPTAVSGTASTAPASNFNGCTLVFKKSATQVLLFARMTLVANGTPNCANPATNSSGNTSVSLAGTLGARGRSRLRDQAHGAERRPAAAAARRFQGESEAGQRVPGSLPRLEQAPQPEGHVRLLRHW